jgi:catechol 2,3-dioxygenase-like lactoylglutathione lyase family enzyme
VTDVPRSQAFYTQVLGFQVALPGPPDDDPDGLVADALQGGVVLINAGVVIGLRPVDATNADDRIDPFRVGLDHLSFAVESRDDLDALEAIRSRRREAFLRDRPGATWRAVGEPSR